MNRRAFFRLLPAAPAAIATPAAAPAVAAPISSFNAVVYDTDGSVIDLGPPPTFSPEYIYRFKSEVLKAARSRAWYTERGL